MTILRLALPARPAAQGKRDALFIAADDFRNAPAEPVLAGVQGRAR